MAVGSVLINFVRLHTPRVLPINRPPSASYHAITQQLYSSPFFAPCSSFCVLKKTLILFACGWRNVLGIRGNAVTASSKFEAQGFWAATSLNWRPFFKFHSPMLEYCCPPARNGRACTDSSSSHGWVRCIPCNCYLITSTLQDHFSKAGHRSKAGLIGNVASKGLSKPGNPQPASSSQSSSSNLHSTLPENASTRSGTKASKGPEYKHCKPCGLTLHVNSWKDHTSGKKHLQKVASSGPPNASTPPQASSPQVTPSNLPSTRPTNASPLSGGSSHSTPTVGTSPLVSGSREGGSRTKVAYCATTLQGETCTDSRCQYLHDVVRCEPCGRSYPSSLFNQHVSGRLHLDKVASNGPTDSTTSQLPLPSPRAPPIPQPTLPKTTPPHAPPILQPTPPTPPQTTPPPSQAISGPSVPTADLLGRVIVSHEGGLDLIVEGTGPTTCPYFPIVNHNVSIKKTAEVSSISVESMTLASSTGQWCELIWCLH